MAGEAARGATLYVTLEPCCHAGRGPACTDGLVAAGVARVVSALADPDPRTADEGHRRLAAAGIDVSTGVLEEEARLAHAGHISRLTRNRPHVTLKLAVSADGMIGRASGERMIISGRPAFDRVQALRAESDAVMIGVGTALLDDPRLTVRHPGLEGWSPIRIVADSHARLPLSSRLVQSAGEHPLWLLVSAAAPRERIQPLIDSGVDVLAVEGGPGGLSLAAALRLLAERGLTRVLAEGGARLAASLISGDLAGEVILFRAPVVVGSEGVRALAGLALSAVERSPRYRLVEGTVIGTDHMRRYLRS
jgi:diaminohydroxyphosphoribosylaminopyrimidine deaminase/5-amino-6-(5-phosphoribosylamino)uracil reductase